MVERIALAHNVETIGHESAAATIPISKYTWLSDSIVYLVIGPYRFLTMRYDIRQLWSSTHEDNEVIWILYADVFLHKLYLQEYCNTMYLYGRISFRAAFVQLLALFWLYETA